MRELGSPLDLPTSLVGTFEGMFFNLFLPTSVGGDAARAYRAFDRGASPVAAIESALIDRAIGLWGVGLSLLAVGPLASLASLVDNYGTMVALSAIIVGGGVAVAVFGSALVIPTRFRSWMRAIADLVHNYGRVIVSKRFLLIMLPALLVNIALTSAAMWLLISSLNFELSFADAVVVLQASTLAALLPVSFGGWGVREGVMVFLLLAVGIDTTGAAAVSVLFGSGLAVLGMIGAVVWLCSPYRGLVRFSDMRLRRPAIVDATDDEGNSK